MCFTQGCAVCYHPPCTDEPRIRLVPGSIVRVTRWKKYWLYGELVQDKSQQDPKVFFSHENDSTIYWSVNKNPQTEGGDVGSDGDIIQPYHHHHPQHQPNIHH